MRVLRMTLKWNGKALLQDVLKAAVPAMNDTTRAVVQNAQGKVRRRLARGTWPTASTRKTPRFEGDEVASSCKVGVSDKHDVISTG